MLSAPYLIILNRYHQLSYYLMPTNTLCHEVMLGQKAYREKFNSNYILRSAVRPKHNLHPELHECTKQLRSFFF